MERKQPETVRLVDPTILDRLAADLDANLVAVFVSVYLDEMVGRVERIVNARECRDWATIQAEAHALKASSGTYGAICLTDWSNAAGAACRDGATASIERLVDELPDIASRTRHSLAPWSRVC